MITDDNETYKLKWLKILRRNKILLVDILFYGMCCEENKRIHIRKKLDILEERMKVRISR